MTNIIFYKNNGYFTKYEVNGHTGYGVYGSDTLCASISSIIQSGAIGLNKVLNIPVKIKRNDKSGYFLVELPDNLTKTDYEKTQIVFSTIYESLLDLESGYSKYMKLEVKELCL